MASIKLCGLAMLIGLRHCSCIIRMKHCIQIFSLTDLKKRINCSEMPIKEHPTVLVKQNWNDFQRR